MKAYLGTALSFLGAAVTMAITGVLYVARAIPRIDGRIDTIEVRQTEHQRQHDDLKDWMERMEGKQDQLVQLMLKRQ